MQSCCEGNSWPSQSTCLLAITIHLEVNHHMIPPGKLNSYSCLMRDIKASIQHPAKKISNGHSINYRRKFAKNGFEQWERLLKMQEVLNRGVERSATNVIVANLTRNKYPSLLAKLTAPPLSECPVSSTTSSLCIQSANAGIHSCETASPKCLYTFWTECNVDERKVGHST